MALKKKLKIQGDEVRVNQAEEFVTFDSEGKAIGTGGKISEVLENKADKSATVSSVDYDETNKKITKTINGTTSDVVLVGKIKTDLGLTKADVGLSNVTDDAQLKEADRHNVIESGTTDKIPTVQAVCNYHDTSKVDVIKLGVAEGVATLDENGKLVSSQLPDYILGQLMFGGTIEKVTTPSEMLLAYPSSALKSKLSLGTDENIQLIDDENDETIVSPKKYGYKTLKEVYFICRSNFTAKGKSGDTEFKVGDWLIGAGTYWDKIENVDAVVSVNTKIGAVVLTTTDVQPVTGATDNLYVSATEKSEWSGKQDKLSDTNKLNQNYIDFTEAEKKAIKSGIESDKVASYDSHIADTVKHIQTSERDAWNAKQNEITSTNKLSSSLVTFTSAESGVLASGITSEKVTKYDGYESTIGSKVDKESGKSLVSDSEITKLSGVLAEGFTTESSKKYMVIIETNASNIQTKKIIEYSFE